MTHYQNFLLFFAGITVGMVADTITHTIQYFIR